MRALFKIARLLRKNPRLALNKIRTTLRDKWFAQADYRAGQGRAHPPSTVCLKLTNACNLRCKMCGQPREGHSPGDIKYAPPEYFQQRLALEPYKQLIDELKPQRPNLSSMGRRTVSVPGYHPADRICQVASPYRSGQHQRSAAETSGRTNRALRTG
ncbi:MAG: hypothetical protein U5R06_23345 [candidate division KSB1 bacterium]|nr:hypothetical protein [candidate division KSB1 bacterium]